MHVESKRTVLMSLSAGQEQRGRCRDADAQMQMQRCRCRHVDTVRKREGGAAQESSMVAV